jgi:HSP20 family protein
MTYFLTVPASVEICDQPQSRFVTATFELPGLKKEEIGVHLTNDGRLTISGDRRPPPFLTNTEPAFCMYPVKELKYGRFERTITVPVGLEVWLFLRFSPCGALPQLVTLTRLIQVKDINASLADGMLIVSWPRTISPPALPHGPTHVVGMA